MYYAEAGRSVYPGLVVFASGIREDTQSSSSLWPNKSVSSSVIVGGQLNAKQNTWTVESKTTNTSMMVFGRTKDYQYKLDGLW